MVISLICNAVSFISALVIFLNFRKVLRLYKEAKAKYDDLYYKHFAEVSRDNDKLTFENIGLKSKVDELEKQVKGLDSRNGMDTIDDYKDKIRTITESYERQHKCSVNFLCMDREREVVVKL